MKKLFKKITLSVLTLLSAVAVTSCSKSDGDGNDLKGFWISPEESYTIYGTNMYVTQIDVYEFVNGNTVKYGELFNKSSSEGHNYSSSPYVKLNGYKNWYVWEGRELRTFTYTYKDGKVIIPMIGKILTVSGKTMIPDGGSTVFTKTKSQKK